MEERNYLIILYDYYGELLTDKQRMYFEDYYFNNLSLGEISENDGYSRNAIHKNIFATLGLGILAWLVIAIILLASLFLLVTVVGAPLAFVLGLLCLVPLTIANTLSVIAIASLLGNKVKLFGKAHNLLAIILVSTVIWALALIPYYVGLAISTLVMLFGLGLFAQSIFTKKEKVEDVISE